MPKRPSIVLAVALLTLFGLSAAACGDDTSSDVTSSDVTAAGSSAEPAPPEPAPAPAEPASPPAGAADPAPQPPETPEPDTPDTGASGAANPAGGDAEEGSEASSPAGDTPSTEAGSDTGNGGPTEAGATQDAQEPAGNGFPVTIESVGGTWTLDAVPQRIVSLSPTSTEILFAIGAGPQVVAVDNWSTYPPEAPTTELSGFDPNIEAITSYEPDLVVIANDTNELVAGLTALDIPVFVSASPFDISGGYGAVAALGAATGHPTEAQDVIETMQAEIAEALANAPEVPIRIYHELDDTHFSVSSNSFIGAVYAALGTVNIADPADGDGYGYPQLTEEYIIEADPELIIITDLLAYTADDVAARPGWETVTAVRDGNILVVNADIASRWGPRLPQFVTTIVEALAAIAATP